MVEAHIVGQVNANQLDNLLGRLEASGTPPKRHAAVVDGRRSVSAPCSGQPAVRLPWRPLVALVGGPGDRRHQTGPAADPSAARPGTSPRNGAARSARAEPSPPSPPSPKILGPSSSGSSRSRIPATSSITTRSPRRSRRRAGRPIVWVLPVLALLAGAGLVLAFRRWHARPGVAVSDADRRLVGLGPVRRSQDPDSRHLGLDVDLADEGGTSRCSLRDLEAEHDAQDIDDVDYAAPCVTTTRPGPCRRRGRWSRPTPGAGQPAGAHAGFVPSCQIGGASGDSGGDAGDSGRIAGDDGSGAWTGVVLAGSGSRNSAAVAGARSQTRWRLVAIVTSVLLFGVIAGWLVRRALRAGQSITGNSNLRSPTAPAPSAVDASLAKAAGLVTSGKIGERQALPPDPPIHPEPTGGGSQLRVVDRPDRFVGHPHVYGPVDEGSTGSWPPRRACPPTPTRRPSFRGFLANAKNDPSDAVTELQVYLGTVDPSSPQVPQVEACEAGDRRRRPQRAPRARTRRRHRRPPRDSRGDHRSLAAGTATPVSARAATTRFRAVPQIHPRFLRPPPAPSERPLSHLPLQFARSPPRHFYVSAPSGAAVRSPG